MQNQFARLMRELDTQRYVLRGMADNERSHKLFEYNKVQVTDLTSNRVALSTLLPIPGSASEEFL